MLTLPTLTDASDDAVSKTASGPSRRRRMGAAVAGLGLAGATLGLTSPASADHGDSFYEGYSGTLAELNGSGVTGTIDADVLSDDRVAITLEVTGVAADLPHAQHFHGMLMEANTCPTPDADANEDGKITVIEGIPFYGGIQSSLTTEGDTSAESALAVDRYPVTSDGSYTYTRVIDVEGDVATYLGNLQVVVHGVDLDESGTYNGPDSTLNSSVPEEATLPAACGSLDFDGINLPPTYRDAEADSVEGFVIRSYSALLGRAPDAQGYDFWVDARTNGGWTNAQTVEFFANSPEFVDRYGDMWTNATDGEWVDFIYQSVLGRLPDASGKAYWENRLATDLTRGEIILFFSDSAEYRAAVHG